MVSLLTLLLLVTSSVYSGNASSGDYSDTKSYISSNLTDGGGNGASSSYYSQDPSPSVLYHYSPYQQQQQQQQYSTYSLSKRPNYDYRSYEKRPPSPPPKSSSRYDKDDRRDKKPPKKRRYTDKRNQDSDEVPKPRSAIKRSSTRPTTANRRNHDVDPHGRKLKNKTKSKTSTTKSSKPSKKYYKKPRIDRQQDDYDDDYKDDLDDYSEEEEDRDNEVDDRRRPPEDEDQEGTGMEPVYDYPEDVADNDLDEGESNLDLDTTDGDPDQEETFQRPSIIDLDDGFDLAAAGLNTVMPGFGVGLKGMRRFVRPFLRPFRSRRFGPRRFFRNASRFMIVFFLLPILLLFIPIPILSSNTNGSSTISRNGLATPAEQLVQVGKRVLSSEQCIERISCEINRWTSDNGRKVDQTDMFRRLMKITNQLDNFFPTFMVRMAKGYVGFEVPPPPTPAPLSTSHFNNIASNSSTIASCAHFDCSKLPEF